MSWQPYNRFHFVLFVMNISNAKFEEHCFNISRDILYMYSLIYHFSCTPQKCEYMYLQNEKKMVSSRNPGEFVNNFWESHGAFYRP